MSFPASEAIRHLKRSAAAARLPHAILLAGPEGSGKRAIAGEMIGFLLETGKSTWPPPPHPDLHVILPESKSRRILIEQIRDLEHLMHLRPSTAPGKVGVILDADRLQPQAANAFLKTLEEPPKNSFLFLTTSNPSAMLTTILSRCVTITLRPSPQSGGEMRDTIRSMFDQFLERGPVTLPAILSLVRGIESLLQKIRETTQEEAEEQLKHEKKSWPEGMPSDVTKAVEARLKAAAESRYLAARADLINEVALWWLDLARNLAVGKNVPQSASSKKFSLADVLGFLDALEALRDQLDRNVHETLAIETAFLYLCDRVEA